MTGLKHLEQCQEQRTFINNRRQLPQPASTQYHGTLIQPLPPPPPGTAVGQKSLGIRVGERGPNMPFFLTFLNDQVCKDLTSTEPSPLREPQTHWSLTLGTMPLTSRLGLRGRRQEPLRAKNCFTSSRPVRRIP